MFVIVDPGSSGMSLSSAFAEQGWPCCHLYGPARQAEFAVDPSRRTMLHQSFDETINALTELAPLGVIAGSESGIELANELAQSLGLAHNEPDLARARRDIVRMSHVLEAADVACPATELVASAHHLDALMGQVDIFPLVFRPVGGATGITLCMNPREARRAYREFTGQGESSGVLVQEYLAGSQYLVNTVSRGGEHLVTEVYAERVDELNRRPVFRHTLLLRDLDDVGCSVVRYVRSCLDALGVREGPAHCRVRVTTFGPVLTGAQACLMEQPLPADTYVPGLGYSQATVLAESYLDPATFERRLRAPYRPERLVCRVPLSMHRSGVIRDMKGLDALRRLPGFHSLAQVPSLGARVHEPWRSPGAGGLAHFVHEDAEVLRSSLRQVHELEDRGGLYLITALLP